MKDSNSDAALSEHLRGLFSAEWKLKSPPTSLWPSLKGLASHNEELLQGLTQITDLSSLQSLIERYVKNERGAELLQTQNCTVLRLALQRCAQQNALPDILSMISDIIARLNYLRLPIHSGILTTGILFAMLNLSAPTLERFLGTHSLIGLPAFGQRESIRIISNCSKALEYKAFENPNYDPSPMLAAVTGEGDLPTSHPRLHDCLYWTQPSDQSEIRYNSQLSAQEYICLLVKLGSNEVLHTCWSSFLKNIQPQNYHSCLAAYQVVLALIQSARPGLAVKYLEDISTKCGDSLPFIAIFPNLQIFIDDPAVGEALPDLVRGQDYIKLLEARLEDIDHSMGVWWHHECQDHFSATPQLSESIWGAFGDQLVPNIKNGAAKPDHEGQLYTALRRHGCSKSPAALNMIVNLLHDHTGQSLEIATHLDYDKQRLQEFRSRFGSLEFRWAPEHSPIEFSDSRISPLLDSTKPSAPRDLGLLRARLMVGGTPQSGAHSLHLMQLGCIDVRYSLAEPWKPSHCIVAWDRHLGELLGLFVGQTSVFDSGPAPVGPFGALMHIRLSSDPRARTLPSETPAYPRNCWGPYYLDVDPSPDLEFAN